MADIAAELGRISRALASKGARTGAAAAGNEFIRLTLPHVPVRSGALRRSVRLKVSGGGTSAVASAAPHTVYAAIINFGGTIHVKHTYTTKSGKTVLGFLSNGSAFFGRSVTIPGQNYWNLDGKGAAIQAAAQHAIQALIDGAA